LEPDLHDAPIFNALRSARIAVTGGNGFLGAHLLRRLSAMGSECCVFMREEDSARRLKNLTPAPAIQNFLQPGSLAQLVAEWKPDIVFHLGAASSTRRDLDTFRTTLELNLLSTVKLFEALCQTTLRRLVHIGSCEEYGRTPVPFTESAAPDPVSPYSASKAAASSYARMFHNAFGLPVVVMRPSVLYGPGQDPVRLIPELITRLLRDQEVEVTEGKQTRDFLFVDDAVEALLLAAVTPDVAGEIFNLGSGENVTVRRCAELIGELTGKRHLIRFGARAYSPSEIWEYAPDISRARRGLGWQPRTTLIQGLTKTIAAYRDDTDAVS
jgi:nucleoside-diphosphate-sugar epimerase